MNAILFEKRGHQAWITLNRPERRNMINADMFVELGEAWQEVRDDHDIRVAVLTAAGDKDFCCGGDLGEIIPLWTGSKLPETEVEIVDLEEGTKVLQRGEPGEDRVRGPQIMLGYRNNPEETARALRAG